MGVSPFDIDLAKFHVISGSWQQRLVVLTSFKTPFQMEIYFMQSFHGYTGR